MPQPRTPPGFDDVPARDDSAVPVGAPPGPATVERRSTTELFRQWRQAPPATDHQPQQSPARQAQVLSLAVPRRMKQQGRAVLLWTVVLFGMAQLAVTYSMEYWLPVTFRTLLRAKWQRLHEIAAEHPDKPLMLMLGSSRFEYGIEAERFDGLAGADGQPFVAYNYGLPALGSLYYNLSLREMLDAGIRPKVLLVEYLPPLLNEPHKAQTSEEAWTAASWLNLQQLARLWPYFKYRDQKARDWVEARTVPWYVFRREMQSWANGKVHPDEAIRITVPYDAWGHKEQDAVTAEECEARTRTAYGLFHDSLATYKIGTGAARSIHDTLALCRKEGIRPVIVYMPESSVFRGWYGGDGREEVLSFFNDLHDRHGADVINASEWIADEHFVDEHHLTTEGAHQFSGRLRAEVQRILQRPQGNAERNRVAALVEQ